MGPFEVHSDFAVGFVGGIAFTLLLAGLVSVTFMRTTDRYGLGHWKLNLETPLPSMWMNVGYWKNEQGEAIHRFPEACASLLREIVKDAGLLSTGDSPRGPLAILDLGFGCGDQTWELARLTKSAGWPDMRYVGLTLNEAQVQSAQRKLCREVAASSEAAGGLEAESFKVFCANAAKPETWTARVAEAVGALADERFEARWLLALDCLYHFSPSRKPVFKHAAGSLGANVMVFDLLLNEEASLKETAVLRAVGVMMGCPVRTFLTESEYRDQLVECGYDRGSIQIREVTGDVFPGLVKFLDQHDRALGEYGISLGGFKLAQRLFDWFGRSRVVRASIVVARTKGKSS